MKTFFCFLTCFCCHYINAQSFQDFEFLDHDQATRSVETSHLYKDSIMYVSHNENWPMTTISIAHSDNTKNSIYESIAESRSKKVEQEDGSVLILLYHLFDYDIFLNGFVAVRLDENGYQIDTCSLEFNSNCFENLPIVQDIDVKSNGNYCFIGYENDLYEMEDNMIINSYNNIETDLSNIYVNGEDSLFTYGNNILYHFNDGKFDTIKTFQTDILNIKRKGNSNLVLLDNRLREYSADFSEVLNDWQITDMVSDFNKLSIDDNGNLYQLIVSLDSIKVFKTDVGNNSDIVVSKFYEDEKFFGLHVVDDTSFLVQGIAIEEDFLSNSFFRHISTVPSNYKKSDFDLVDFEIYRESKDSTFNGVYPGTTDSVFFYNYTYQIDFEIQNLSEEIINNFNLFNNKINYEFTNFRFILNFAYSDLVLDQGSYFSGDTMLRRQVQLESSKLFGPGANYRFNKGNNTISVDYSTDIEKIRKTDDFKIYPNPSSNVIYLETEKPIYSYSIYDNLGQLVLLNTGRQKVKTINIESLQAGSYYLKIDNGVSQFIKM